MPSNALEANIKSSRVDVIIREEYHILMEVMERYTGITENLKVFITELCHPYKNWRFIIKEARGYSLDYFHLLKGHEKGPIAASLFVDIFLDTITESQDTTVYQDGADNLLVYIQKIINEANEDLASFLPVIEHGLKEICDLNDDRFLLFVKSFYQINRIISPLAEITDDDPVLTAANNLLARYLKRSYDFWAGHKDPLEWFINEAGLPVEAKNDLDEIFANVSHEELKKLKETLERNIHDLKDDKKKLFKVLISLPGYRQIADHYRNIPRLLFKKGEETGRGQYWKLIFLFHIMNTDGLNVIHEETLREVNRTLTLLINTEKPKNLQPLILKTFGILKQSVNLYPGTALNCVGNMGNAIYRTDESELVDFFLESVMELGFQTPDFKGVGNDWQAKVNMAHILNIRTWLEIIEINPAWSKKLLSSMIIYLSIGGVYIKDTDLFPRDITNLLNSDIAGVYNLIKQLTRLFPAYFNEIGAEGQLRDISTRLDEITFRKDALVHFLRKQSHVESSNRIIGLMESMLHFWLTKERDGLEEYLPPDIYMQVEEEGPYFDGVHLLINELFQKKGLHNIKDLLDLDINAIKEISGIKPVDKERLELSVVFYRLLVQKYSIDSLELEGYVNQLPAGSFPEINLLKEALKQEDPYSKINDLLAYLEKLKGIILSQERYEIREDIYHKRHFTVDIPSMYGSYHEKKFDALGMTFRLESFVNTLFDDLVQETDLALITRETFFRINDYLILFYRALRLDGIISSEIEKQLDLLGHSLRVRGFTFTQFIDIFRGFSQAVSNLVNDYFNSIHEENLTKIITKLPKESLLPKYNPEGELFERERLTHRVSEVFLRERIAFALGLQQLDLFLTRIMSTLFRQADELPNEKLHLLLNYDPQKAISPIASPNPSVSGVIHMGNKGYNLVSLHENGFRVPPGFIITTEVYRYWEIIEGYQPAEINFRKQVERELSGIEKQTGRFFGNPEKPLLLSVRSGAPISQPGMMDTFLNVGINEEIVHGIINITGNAWFAWDCYRRFLQSYGMAFGLNRNDFDDIIGRAKEERNVLHKIDLTGEKMRETAFKYRDFISGQGIMLEESPVKQLYIIIDKVLKSWNTGKAKAYRKIMKLSDDWGTAVIIQSMVFGNRAKDSGSGVLFTHNPRLSGGLVTLWGDYTLGNQGEDVVSGLVNTLPLSERQAEIENRDVESSLQISFPEIYNAMKSCASELIYEKNWSPQEMEFTFESSKEKDLYFLQTRDMAIRHGKKVLSFVGKPDTNARFIGHGIGVSGGAMSGRVVFNLEEIRAYRKTEPETPLILVRGDTVPDDIQEIFESDGLLTARGGSTSHAAIVAHRLEKTCVVGSPNLVCMERDSSCSIEQIHLKTGDWLSIDGREGSIYMGKLEIEEMSRR
ncbi:MAG: pyruvate, phosphate dikinase [Deltaproteobacteria bacterium]|nr:pyruvate, phosphate dikinase [Deltaproteobacteria bacterium]